MTAFQDANTEPFLACMASAGIPAQLRNLFDEDAEDNLEAYISSSAPNSLAAFRTDILRWCVWAHLAGVDPLAPRARHVRDFTREFAGEDRRPQTIKRMVTSIGTLIEGICANKNVTHSKVVKAELKRLRRERGSHLKQALAIRQKGDVAHFSDPALPFSLQAMIKVLEPDESLKAARAKFLLSLGGDTGRRVSEYTDAQMRHLFDAADGTGVFLVERSKTDQDGNGIVRFVSRRTMRLRREWCAALEAAGANVSPDTPLLVSIDKHGNASTRGRPSSALTSGGYRIALRGAVRMALNLSGADDPELMTAIPDIVRRISGHSFRVGMVEDLVTAGESVAAICIEGGWETPAMVVRYARNLSTRTGAVARLRDLLGDE